MTSLEIGLLAAVGCLLPMCIVSIYYNIKHGLLILKTTDSIEQALDLLDARYTSINKVLEIPLFYDSPQIRQVLDDIEGSRNAILQVANYMAHIEDDSHDVELGE